MVNKGVKRNMTVQSVPPGSDFANLWRFIVMDPNIGTASLTANRIMVQPYCGLLVV